VRQEIPSYPRFYRDEEEVGEKANKANYFFVFFPPFTVLLMKVERLMECY
jgi:hypothetical protein